MERCIGFEIRGLSNLLKRELNQDTDSDMCNTALHGLVIEFLATNKDKDIFQKDFEEEFSMRKSTISRMLKKMEENGMILRVPVNEDSRLKKIVLTPDAFKVHEEIRQKRIDIEEKIRKDISVEDLNIFFEVVDQIKKNIE